MNFLKRYLSLIGLAFFVFILSRLDFVYYKEILPRIDFLKFTAAILLVFPTVFLKTFRWRELMKAQGIYYPFWESFRAYFSGIYIGFLTPGGLGEVSRAAYLKKKNYSLGKSFASVFADRFFDVAFLVIFGYIGLFLFSGFFQQDVFLISIIIFSVFFGVFMIAKYEFAKILLRRLSLFFIPSKHKKNWEINFQDFIEGLGIYKFKTYFFVSLSTVISWFVYYLSMFLFARSLGIYEIPFLYIAISTTIAGLIAILPISISGLGTRDAALLFLFSFFHVSKELTVAFSMLILLNSVFAALIGFICYLKRPLLSGSSEEINNIEKAKD